LGSWDTFCPSYFAKKTITAIPSRISSLTFSERTLDLALLLTFYLFLNYFILPFETNN
jgi:hypothetical protein